MIQLEPTRAARLLVLAAKLAKPRANLETAGDFEGHPFRGNQYTGGLASFSVDPSVPRVQREKIRKALDFVEQSKSEHTSKIHLFVTPTAKGNTENPHGYAKRNIKIEGGKPVRDEQGNLVHTGNYTVYISSKQRGTEDFVRTISHEFEHVAQWERGEEPHEAGARAVGNEFSRKFRGLGEFRTARGKEGPLHKLADSYSPKLSVAVRYAFAAARAAMRRKLSSREDIKEATALGIVTLRAELKEVLPGILRKIYVEGGETGVKLLATQFRNAEEFRAAKREPTPKLSFAFDSQTEEAISWADKHAAELITQISETSREDINNAVAEFLETGDFRELRDEILAAVGDTQRADLIARNEPMIAVHQGQREAWNQAIEEGLLPETAVREWIVVGDDKVCPVCEGLEGRTAGIGEEYDEGIEGPPAHVACRCSEGLTGVRSLAFNPDQPRDEDGKWSGSGGFFERNPKLIDYKSVPIIRSNNPPKRNPEAEAAGGKVYLYPKFEKLDPKSQDFVVAHELGHVVLDEHGLPNLVSDAEAEGIDVWNDLPFAQSNMHEAFADSFASYHTDEDVVKRYPKWTKLVQKVVNKRKLRVAEFNPDQPRDDDGKWTSGGSLGSPASGEANSPEEAQKIIEEEQKKWLTPEEFERLPPGIRAWKTRTRREKAEGKEPTPKKEEKSKEPEKPKVEDKPGVIATREREKAITARANEITSLPNAQGGKPWMDALEQARKEDEEKNGPLPPNALSKRTEAINERYEQLKWEARERNNQLAREGKPTEQINSEKFYRQAKEEDAQKWGPWAYPEEVEAIRASDKNWSPSQHLAAQEAKLGSDFPRIEREVIAPEHQSIKQTAVRATADAIAREMNFPAELIAVRDRGNSPRTFELNGKKLTEGGHYNPQTGRIEVNASFGVDRGLIVHEIQHAQWNYVRDQAGLEQSALQSRWAREQAVDFSGNRYFLKNGKVMAKYRDEFERQMPYTSTLARAGLGNKELGIKADIEGMKRDDGVSSYSKEYWTQAEEKRGFDTKAQTTNYIGELAVNETLSEVARRVRQPGSQTGADFGYKMPDRFVKLNKEVEKLYNKDLNRVQKYFARKRQN